MSLMLTKSAYIIKEVMKKTVILQNIIIILNDCFLCEHILKYNLFLWCKAEF